jgi:hypothetical protein
MQFFCDGRQVSRSEKTTIPAGRSRLSFFWKQPYWNIAAAEQYAPNVDAVFPFDVESCSRHGTSLPYGSRRSRIPSTNVILARRHREQR